jgi:retron-type reverse transcriptase
LLEKVLAQDTLNKNIERVRSKKAAAGVYGVTIDEMLPYITEQGNEFGEEIRNGKYRSKPDRRVKIPKSMGV